MSFIRLNGIKIIKISEKYNLQLYYPEGQLRLGKEGRDFYFSLVAFVIRINSDDTGRCFGFRLLGFGFGIGMLSDKELNYRERLYKNESNRN